MTSSLWKRVYALNPRLLGGCRPVHMAELLDSDQWHVEHREYWTESGSVMRKTPSLAKWELRIPTQSCSRSNGITRMRTPSIATQW